MDIQKIAFDSLRPSPMNPRKTFDENSLQELAENIESQGLLQPIIIRPIEQEPMFDSETNTVITIPVRYEIVCGERRYRAIKMLKEKEDALNVERVASHRKKYDRFQTISAIVQEMTDEEAFDAMITENLQRKDVDPIEEAFAFGKLLENGKSVEDIAARFGKSIRFVQDRIKLNTLIPELKKAVREDKCPISSAMLISKLDQDKQKEWSLLSENSYYDGYSKKSAQNFVNGLFMMLGTAPWYESEDAEDEKFSGGCGISCADCEYNTANRACLFWEMKTDDDGKCTNRQLFIEKNIAYLMSVIGKNADEFVKAGHKLESGKTVIIYDINYMSDSAKVLFDSAEKAIKEAGYELIKASSLFCKRCWYNEGDERLQKMIKSGEVYRCLNFMKYNRICPEYEYYYIRDNSENGQETNAGSLKAMELAMKYNRNESIYQEKITSDLRELANEQVAKDKVEELDVSPLDKDEIVALLAIIVKEMNVRNLSEKMEGLLYNGEMLYKWLATNEEKFPLIIREYIRYYLTSNSVNYDSCIQFVQQNLLSKWLSDEAQTIVDKHRADLDKKHKRLEERLSELGYDTKGKLINA